MDLKLEEEFGGLSKKVEKKVERKVRIEKKKMLIKELNLARKKLKEKNLYNLKVKKTKKKKKRVVN